MTEIEQLKYWLDSELSLNHAYYWAILGVLIGGNFWWIAGPMIGISLVYAYRRAGVIRKGYLNLPKKGDS